MFVFVSYLVTVLHCSAALVVVIKLKRIVSPSIDPSITCLDVFRPLDFIFIQPLLLLFRLLMLPVC